MYASSVTVSSSHLAPAELHNAFAAAKRYAAKGIASSTLRAYINDWRKFETWCKTESLLTLPAIPDTVAYFIANQAHNGLSPSTLGRSLAAIRLVHLGTGHPSPHNALTVVETMHGIRRDWSRPPNRKAVLLYEDLIKMVDTVDLKTTKGLRDRALILFAYAGGFRRSELVALNTWNLEESGEGFKVEIKKLKSDHESKDHTIVVIQHFGSQYCPVQALQEWLAAAKIESGALFRRIFRGDNVGSSRISAQSVALLVKDYASRAGLDWGRYSSHSLRSGFLTAAATNRADVFEMIDKSQHKSLSVLRQFVKKEEVFEDNEGDDLL